MVECVDNDEKTLISDKKEIASAKRLGRCVIVGTIPVVRNVSTVLPYVLRPVLQSNPF